MRLIDADALVEDLEKVYEFYMNEIKEANENTDNYTSKFLPATAGAIDGLVDAEIVINNAPTIEPDGDLISRRDVLNMIIVADECEPDLGYMHLHKVVENIPSAESTGAMDEAIQKYIKDGYMQPIGEDLISRQDAIEAFRKSVSKSETEDSLCYNLGLGVAEKVLESLPSAEPKKETVLCALADRTCPFQGKEYAWCLTCPHISEEDRNLIKRAIEPKTGECRTCGRNADNGGVHEDGRTKCPIQEHYALLLDGYCHLYEPYNCGAKMKGGDDE